MCSCALDTLCSVLRKSSSIACVFSAVVRSLLNCDISCRSFLFCRCSASSKTRLSLIFLSAASNIAIVWVSSCPKTKAGVSYPIAPNPSLDSIWRLRLAISSLYACVFSGEGVAPFLLSSLSCAVTASSFVSSGATPNSTLFNFSICSLRLATACFASAVCLSNSAKVFVYTATSWVSALISFSLFTDVIASMVLNIGSILNLPYCWSSATTSSLPLRMLLAVPRRSNSVTNALSLVSSSRINPK